LRFPRRGGQIATDTLLDLGGQAPHSGAAPDFGEMAPVTLASTSSIASLGQRALR
jgi:hypothetical protein